MRVLISAQIKKKIQEILDYAESNPIGLSETHCPSPLDTSKRTVDIPEGIRCTFSIEHHMIGLCKRLSLSVINQKDMVHPAAALALCELFGFKRSEDRLTLKEIDHIWREELDPGLFVINLLQKIS